MKRFSRANTFERETQYQGGDSDDDNELDSESEGDEEDDEQVNITNDHTRIIHDLDALRPEGLVPAEFEKISLEKNYNRTGANGKTLLHHVVTQFNARNCDKRIKYAKWLLHTCPGLFGAENSDGQTALYTAIEGNPAKDLIKFLNFFFSSFKAESREVLNRWNEKCFHFHTAIKKLGPFMTTYLSEMVNSDILERQDEDGNTPLHIAVDVRTWKKRETMAKRVELVEKLISLCPGALMIENSQKTDHPPLSPYKFYSYTNQIPKADDRSSKGHTHTPAQTPAHTPLQPLFENPTQAKLQAQPSLKFSLINAYMHIANRDESIRHLYGDAQDREIQFDLLELTERSKSLQPGFLKNLPQYLNHLEFECVLRYVCLPKIPREDIPESFSNGEGAHLHDHRESLESSDQADFGVILEWLKRKMVRKIIKLTVLDDPSTPYCDESIVKALEDIDIEVWNWNKFDLCSDTIFEAAPNAKEVTLYSTGNRAVLRSWFSKHGLRKLKKRLESGRVGPDPRDHKSYLQQRLKKHLPNIELDIEYGGASKPQPAFSTSLDTDTALNKDSWLECMENFAEFIYRIPSKYEEAAGSPEIKIAVLDDGIDAFHERFQGSIAGGISFCEWRREGVETDGMKSHCFSSTGHGTEMADRIRQVFPKAKLYIARLDVKKSGENRTPEITAKSAAKAILWAINQKVDIISMSWTLEETSQNSDHIKALERAILKANDQNILMFCAAKDGGHNQIGSQLVGSQAGKVNFFFPGENLTSLSTQSVEGISGSSLATALAAGFAGLLLYCVQIGKQGASTNSESGCERRRRKLQNFNKMDETLTAMVTDSSTKYIPVSIYFNKVNSDFPVWAPSQDNMLNGVFDRLPWYAKLVRDDE